VTDRHVAAARKLRALLATQGFLSAAELIRCGPTGAWLADDLGVQDARERAAILAAIEAARRR
jgi:hypothetical protein